MRERGRPSRPARSLNTANGHPLAYLITFTSYGTWLHGDERGSVDRNHRTYEQERLANDPYRTRLMRGELAREPVVLTPAMRETVAAAISRVCAHREWRLDAINVRTNHVHVVVGADDRPERVMNAFKSWATRRCREAGQIESSSALWTRHGSTRYLWQDEDVAAAVDYVLNRQ